MAQDTSFVSRQTQFSGQAGYSLSPHAFSNSIEAGGSGLTSPCSRENVKELLIRKGYLVVTVIAAYQEDLNVTLLIMLLRFKS